MARIILITGGARSGKSTYAQTLAEGLPGRRAFLATCPAVDDEMKERIRKHQQARSQSGWHTIEETTDLTSALRGATQYQVIVVDCLTLWINNLMYETEQSDGQLDEERMEELCNELVATCAELEGTVIFVTNEVGMGIVPAYADARRFRDLVGRCNQGIAARADVVTLVTCGIPSNLKG